MIAEFAEVKFPNIFKAFKGVLETFESFMGLKKGEIVGEEIAEDALKTESKLGETGEVPKTDHLTEPKTEPIPKENEPLKLPAPHKIHKHHVLPQKFRKWFEKRGIVNIDDYTIQISSDTHLKGVHGL